MKNYLLKLKKLDVIKIAVTTQKILIKTKGVEHSTLEIGNQLDYNNMPLNSSTVKKIQFYYDFFLLIDSRLLICYD
jgi:hypothetical protein